MSEWLKNQNYLSDFLDTPLGCGCVVFWGIVVVIGFIIKFKEPPTKGGGGSGTGDHWNG